MEWNYGSIIRLIKEYEKRSELWNPQNELYRSTPKKHEAWASLAQTLDADVVDVRRKLNSLFASFRREKSKIRQGLGTKWFLYKYLKFLPSYEKEIYVEKDKEDENDEHNEITEYLEENEEDEEDNNQVENQPEGEYIELTTDDNQQVIIKQEHHETIPKIYPQRSFRKQIKRIIPTPNYAKKKVKILRRFDQDYRERQIRPEYPKKKDDCDSFGEYIADSLRKHDERTKSMIKHAINNIIFEQEMKKYSNHYEIVHEIENPLVLGEE